MAWSGVLLPRARSDETITIDCTRPVRTEIDVLHFSNQPLLDIVHTHSIAEAGCSLRPKLGFDTRLARCLSQRAHLGDIVAERLLTIHVLARTHRCHRDGEVHVVWHGNVD